MDREQASPLAPISDQVADQIIKEFYTHILSFERAADQFSSEGLCCTNRLISGLSLSLDRVIPRPL